MATPLPDVNQSGRWVRSVGVGAGGRGGRWVRSASGRGQGPISLTHPPSFAQISHLLQCWVRSAPTGWNWVRFDGAIPGIGFVLAAPRPELGSFFPPRAPKWVCFAPTRRPASSGFPGSHRSKWLRFAPGRLPSLDPSPKGCEQNRTAGPGRDDSRRSLCRSSGCGIRGDVRLGGSLGPRFVDPGSSSRAVHPSREGRSLLSWNPRRKPAGIPEKERAASPTRHVVIRPDRPGWRRGDRVAGSRLRSRNLRSRKESAGWHADGVLPMPDVPERPERE
jgi:hypothetical protein